MALKIAIDGKATIEYSIKDDLRAMMFEEDPYEREMLSGQMNLFGDDEDDDDEHPGETEACMRWLRSATYYVIMSKVDNTGKIPGEPDRVIAQIDSSDNLDKLLCEKLSGMESFGLNYNPKKRIIEETDRDHWHTIWLVSDLESVNIPDRVEDIPKNTLNLNGWK